MDGALVEYLRCQGRTYRQISDLLKQQYPNTANGLSSRSIRRFCFMNSIKKLSNNEIDAIVEEAIHEVCICTCTVYIICSDVPHGVSGIVATSI